MIRYALRCADGHEFDSWFQSAAAFDTLAAAGHLSCAVCGSGEVQKTLMAPRVAGDAKAPQPEAQTETPAEPSARPLAAPRSPAEQAMAALRAHLEANSTFVGRDFARDARAMHLGEAEERPIWGEATGEEARDLLEDGVPVLPLPIRREGGRN
ncbi:hypothetical protein ROJ8625_02347 [Roseivivax jejudonensis]|uniref:DUF1178 family protein n=1 Tax=Roseivivax jejudonensis TaxID=1529041 RepID=A0A1X6ZFG0_9RHOB|nr:DUF1178 family protein [Roseivivax jejudonensis]SLN48276.1 hypothetical protein ROJ8625_02347 [Roseivivax jejudonensis]